MNLKCKEIMDTLELVQKRIEILTGARIRQRHKTSKAMKLQDNLRSKYSNRRKGWTGADEIRKWREKISIGYNFITADKKLYNKVKDLEFIIFLGNVV